MPTFQGYQVDKLALSTTNGGTLNFDDVIVFVPDAHLHAGRPARYFWHESAR